jgi:YD repeat-containing protein
LTFSYTGTNLRIDQITDPLARAVRYTYDAQGRLETVTDPPGGVTRYTYDGNHRLLTITDPRNITFLSNEYDAQGRVSRQTQADGGVFTFEYTVNGGLITSTTVTDPRGNRTISRFNNFGYLVSQTDALGQLTTFERQPGSNLLLSTTDSLGRVTRFTYDTSGSVTTIMGVGSKTT